MSNDKIFFCRVILFKSRSKFAHNNYKNINCYKDYHILKINTTLLMHKTDDVNWNRIQKGMFIVVHSWAVMRKTKLCITFYYWERKIIVLIVEVNKKIIVHFENLIRYWKIFLRITKNAESKMFLSFAKCSFNTHFHQKRYNGSFKWKFRYRIRSWKDIRIDISAYMVLHYC